MSNWEKTKEELAVSEPLDPEIIPLCDALNAAGFVTTASCSGHGRQRPMVWFEHSTDERIESMARFVLMGLRDDLDPHYSARIRKQVYEIPGDYNWSIEANYWDIWHDTPADAALTKWTKSINKIAELINEWRKGNKENEIQSKEETGS
jgi:hypothetical protein